MGRVTTRRLLFERLLGRGLSCAHGVSHSNVVDATVVLYTIAYFAVFGFGTPSSSFAHPGKG